MMPIRPRLVSWITAAFACSLAAAGCTDGEESDDDPVGSSELTVAQKAPRYAVIRDAARSRGMRNAYLLAGIANTETGLAQCWSEATWACQGPSSPDCGGGPVIAGSADGACSAQQGGLGMFQFDAGTYSQTLSRYGQGVLTVDGQIGAAIAYTINMVKISAYTTNAETDAKARDWINNFDINNPTLRDQWVKTVLRYYNGCQPGWSCWSPRYQTYNDGLRMAIDEPGGIGFWAAEAGTRCGNSPMTVGAIDVKYRALGGCGSILGAPTTAEQTPPDGAGRYSVFERGSIYWHPTIGAFEVHGVIRDTWKDTGWESGQLGYPISDEYEVSVGRRNDFQRGAIVWNRSTNVATVENGPPPAPRWKILAIQYQVQETGYWCGPAATRVALSARMNPPSQSTLAQQLGTTTNGTDWIGQVTSVLNNRLGVTRYRTTEMPNDPPTTAQRDRLWNDLVLGIDNHYPLVANIVAPPSNHPPGYPNSTIYHYFSVIGYNPDTRQVFIADTANFGGNQQYWLSFDQLATLIPPKGYSAYACPTGLTMGDIHQKYTALGGCGSVVGGAVSSEQTTPDGVGRFNVFERGSIYWTPTTGAHEVHGVIRDRWRDLGWESGTLGYPTSDEYAVAGGRRSDFQHGALAWNAANGQVTAVQ